MMTRLLGVLAAAIVALGLAAPQAHAVVIYDFTGTCQFGCTGQATAVLTLEDSYTPGTQAIVSDFVSFSYNSDSGSYDIPADAALNAIGGPAVLPAGSGQVDINLFFEGFGTAFDSVPGSWFSIFDPLGINDGGDETEWVLRTSELPEPGPLSLLALGLAGLALAGRRRTKAGA